jgi:ribonucleotide monophosphatase NagD (HAD superfamily)
MLADVDGFVFDLDGTLVRRGRHGYRSLPGADAVIAEVRRSARPLAIFTNASHAPPAAIAAAVGRGGLDIPAEEIITPVCSALSELRRRFDGRPAFAFATDATRERIAGEGIALLDEADIERAEVVLVTHADRVTIEALEAAAYAVRGGAELLTASYAPAYAGADGPILSRGAMLTAAIARVAERRPTVVGKPS